MGLKQVVDLLPQGLIDFVFHHGGRGDYDPNFYAELKVTHFASKIDWKCECEHVGGVKQ